MSRVKWLKQADRTSNWSEAQVVVAGLGVSGYSVADALVELGAHTVVLDESDSAENQQKAKILTTLGARVELGEGKTTQLPAGTDLVVTSPGWRPSQPLLAQAAASQIPIWGDVELAYRLQRPDRIVPWLGVTGTNGKTTTTQMLAAMLAADGLKTAAVGNIGRPIMEAVLDEVQYDVLAVELSSFQLHWLDSLSLHSAVCLNFEDDHLQWYEGEGFGGLTPRQAYWKDKSRIYQHVQHACVYNVADENTRKMVEEADVVEGARAIGFTVGVPSVSMFGVVDTTLVDRAFVPQRQSSALPLAELSDVHPYAPHNVENALAAAALARSFGVKPRAIKQGLKDVQLGEHRIQEVGRFNGVLWIDDSKATNPHAANSAMSAFDKIIWIAGGQAKGTNFDQLVQANREKLRAAILIGVDRQVIAESLDRHAPNIPVIVLDKADTDVIADAVEQAATLANPGDVVLLAPGCASLDMWDGYASRGNDFAAAVRKLNQ